MVAEPPKAASLHRSASGHVVTSITRSDCYRLERQLPGGIRTRQETAPSHGAPTDESYIDKAGGGERIDKTEWHRYIWNEAKLSL